MGEFTTHKAQKGNVKRNKFRPISKETLNHQIRAAFIKAPLNTYSVYRSDPRHPIKALMIMHLVRRNAKSVPWVGEETLAPIGEQDSTGRGIGPRTSKSSSPPEEPGSRIFRGYCAAKRFGDPGPFHIRPMAYAEEEEMLEDEQRDSRLPGYTARDDSVLGRPKSRKGKAPHRQRQSLRASQRKFRAQWASHRSMVEKQFQEKLLPLY